MLESIGKAIMVVGIGTLFIAGVFVLDQCKFTSHLNPAHPSCIQSARSLGSGTLGAADELFTPDRQERDFRRGLTQIREHVDVVLAGLYGVASDFSGHANHWLSQAYLSVKRWYRTEADFWFRKL